MEGELYQGLVPYVTEHQDMHKYMSWVFGLRWMILWINIFNRTCEKQSCVCNGKSPKQRAYVQEEYIAAVYAKLNLSVVQRVFKVKS